MVNPEHSKLSIDITAQSIEEKEGASREIIFKKMQRSFDKDFRRYGVRHITFKSFLTLLNGRENESDSLFLSD